MYTKRPIHTRQTQNKLAISGSKQMRTAPFWVITQRVVVIPYRRFGTTYLSHLQGSRKLILDPGR